MLLRSIILGSIKARIHHWNDLMQTVARLN
jgi:hypothetical protein